MLSGNAGYSARAIALEIDAGRLSPDEVFTEHQKAIDQLEEDIQAFTHRAEKMVAGDGPLRGISVGVKDIFDTRDTPTTHGSPIYDDNQPSADASLVAMLRSAGATIAGKTETTEFAWFNPARTRNPHNLNHTPGGSSSGSAAGVAAGFFSAAIGSQTGGSVVRPAAFCGVAGYKPSFRLFPTVGMKCFSWSLDTPGFFAASVADAAFVASACSGRALNVNEADDTQIRIGVLESSIDDLMDADMGNALEQALDLASKAGAEIVKVAEPQAITDARAAHATIQDFEARLALADEFTHHRELLSPKLQNYLEDAASITPDAYDDARRLANRGRKTCQGLFADCDVLLMPSAPGAAPETLATTGDSVFNRVWTLMGVPSVNVPGLEAKNGLPLGIQVNGRFGDDAKVLQRAHWLEQVLNR